MRDPKSELVLCAHRPNSSGTGLYKVVPALASLEYNHSYGIVTDEVDHPTSQLQCPLSQCHQHIEDLQLTNGVPSSYNPSQEDHVVGLWVAHGVAPLAHTHTNNSTGSLVP